MTQTRHLIPLLYLFSGKSRDFDNLKLTASLQVFIKDEILKFNNFHRNYFLRELCVISVFHGNYILIAVLNFGKPLKQFSSKLLSISAKLQCKENIEAGRKGVASLSRRDFM